MVGNLVGDIVGFIEGMKVDGMPVIGLKEGALELYVRVGATEIKVGDEETKGLGNNVGNAREGDIVGALESEGLFEVGGVVADEGEAEAPVVGAVEPVGAVERDRVVGAWELKFKVDGVCVALVGI